MINTLPGFLLGCLDEILQKRPNIIIDYLLLICILSLLCIGLVMVSSASVSIAEHRSGEPFYFLWRQLVYSAIGIGLASILFFIPMRAWEQTGPVLIVASIFLLLLVFVPGIGREVNGSQRWISFGGFNLQPSELAKLFTIIYLAGYLVRHGDDVRQRAAGFLRPMTLLAVLVLLMLLEPDYGAAAVMLATAMGMMWLGGARVSQFLLLLAATAMVLAVLALIEPYRLTRLTVFMNPWADPFNSGFQLTQALIAFGRGDWFGVGLGAGVQKLFYLPEAHTDFLLAVLGEELGLIGVLLVIALFSVLIFRMFSIGRKAEQREHPFAAYLTYGVAFWVGLQAFINMGVNMGVLPTKGLTLPLMSYGGSSIVVICVAMALVLRTHHETHKHDRFSQRASSNRDRKQ